MGLSRAGFDPAAVQQILDQRGLAYRRRETDLLFPLRGQAGFEGYWGRVEILPAPAQLAQFNELVMDFSVWPEEAQSVVPPNSLLIQEFPLVLESLLQPKYDAQVMIVTGVFLLRTQDWRPAVTLPVQLPGVLDSPSGTPEITGFEFMFREPASELRRAEISLDSEGHELTIKMMVLISPSPADNLIQRACYLLTKHLGLLAVRLGRTEAAAHV